jgi:hypothetical protein
VASTTHPPAADCFTVQVPGWSGLVRHVVFFGIELKTRRVQIAGISCQPTAEWMQQLARNLTDAVDGFLAGKRFPILDRDPRDARDFRRLLRPRGVRRLLLPAKSPNLIAFAESFVLWVKSECLDPLASSAVLSRPLRDGRVSGQGGGGGRAVPLPGRPCTFVTETHRSRVPTPRS